MKRMQRMQTICDRCGSDYDVAFYEVVVEAKTPDCEQPTFTIDLCGMCYSKVSGALKTLLTTDGALVQLPQPKVMT